MAGRNQRRQHGAGDIADVGIPGIHAARFLRADIDSGDVKSGLGELDGQGKTHVSQPNHAHPGGAGADLLRQSLRRAFRSNICFRHETPFSHTAPPEPEAALPGGGRHGSASVSECPWGVDERQRAGGPARFLGQVPRRFQVSGSP